MTCSDTILDNELEEEEDEVDDIVVKKEKHIHKGSIWL